MYVFLCWDDYVAIEFSTAAFYDLFSKFWAEFHSTQYCMGFHKLLYSEKK